MHTDTGKYCQNLKTWGKSDLCKFWFLDRLGVPSKNKNGIFSEKVQKGRRGASSNHFFKSMRKNDKLRDFQRKK